MKITILLGLALLFTPFLNYRDKGVKETKESIVVAGKKRTYYLYVPEGITPSQPVPLLVLLHGSDRNGNSLVEKWKALADKEKIILVGPDAMNPRGWEIPNDGPDFLHELIELLKSKYPINQRKVYLFGHSGGAKFGLIMGLVESRYFAAVVAHGGALTKDAFPFINHAQRKTPLAIVIGDRDQFCPLSIVRDAKAELDKAMIPVEVTILKGHDHYYYDLAPKINDLVWEFLKKNELHEDQQYESYDFQK